MIQVSALIRTHNRPQLFKRCIASAMSQSVYLDIAVGCHEDDNETFDYVRAYMKTIQQQRLIFGMSFTSSSDSPFFYNLYCNEFKKYVSDGWFFFLDDDDYLINDTAIERIIPYLTDPTKVVICQMKRGRFTKPDDLHMNRGYVRKGRVGMPCIFVHASLKDSVMFNDTEGADYDYIKAMIDKHGAVFAKEVIVMSEKRRYGNPN